jgi:HEPN domain-containing protein
MKGLYLHETITNLKMKSYFDTENIINHWIESSDKDFKTMMDMYKTKNNNWALFIGHLVIEKLLKALYLKKTNDFPPLIHDLRRICEKANIELDGNQKINLDTISRFNINARYDDYKKSFYKLCTDGFTKEWIEKIKDSRKWIKKMLSN